MEDFGNVEAYKARFRAKLKKNEILFLKIIKAIPWLSNRLTKLLIEFFKILKTGQLVLLLVTYLGKDTQRKWIDKVNMISAKFFQKDLYTTFFKELINVLRAKQLLVRYN